MVMDNNGLWAECIGQVWRIYGIGRENLKKNECFSVRKNFKEEELRLGSYVLRGITTALLVTVVTLFAGMVWSAIGIGGGLSISLLLDIGLFASCLVGGYRTAKESGQWFMGGVTGAGYVTVGTLLLALFLPIQGWGFIQVLAEGAIIGLVAGAVGAGGVKGPAMGNLLGRRSPSQYTPSYAGYGSNDPVDSDSKFDWDTEEKFQDRRDAPMSSWIETPEETPWESSRSKRDCKDDREVEWSWDREEDERESTSSRTESSELPEVWNPEWVTADTVGCNRGRRSLDNLKQIKARGAKPWWEE